MEKNHQTKTARRILSIFLTVIMLLTSLPVSALVSAEAHIHTKGEWEITEMPASYKKGIQVQKCTECDEILDTKELPETKFCQGETVTMGSYPQKRVEEQAVLDALNALAPNYSEWISYGKYAYGVQTDNMVYIDIDYMGERYRGVYYNALPSYRTVLEGASALWEKTDYHAGGVYWFLYEPIEWLVLDTVNGLLLSKTVLDAREFHYNGASKDINNKTIYSTNYEHSSLRAWLNDSFYNTVFTKNEKTAVIETELDNTADTPEYSADNTVDKVYLLSRTQVLNGSYGFSTQYTSSETRTVKATDYAVAQGCYLDYEEQNNTYLNAYWRLRNAGSFSYYTNQVTSSGYVTQEGAAADYTDKGIRPAITCDLTSQYLQYCEHTYEPTVIAPTCYKKGYTAYTCSECGFSYRVDETEMIAHTGGEWVMDVAPTDTEKGLEHQVCKICRATMTSREIAPTRYELGELIYLGSYPQDKVTDEQTLAALNALDKEWISYGYLNNTTDNDKDANAFADSYMKYTDVTLNGTKYRGVTFTSYRPAYSGTVSTSIHNTTVNGTSCANQQYYAEYFTNTVYWFRYSPIVWSLIEPHTGLCISQQVLDAQPYNQFMIQHSDGKYYTSADGENRADDYSTSSIREWLNDTFLNTAFTQEEREMLIDTDYSYIVPDEKINDETRATATLTDTVLLPTNYIFMHSSVYGFALPDLFCIPKTTAGTAYARAQGSYVGTITSTYWLQDIDQTGKNAEFVSLNYKSTEKDTVNRICGVRPMVKIDLYAEGLNVVLNHPVTVNYVISDGVVEAPATYCDYYRYEESYSIKTPEVEDYKANISVVTGKMINEPITVTVTYTRYQYDVCYVDYNGDVIYNNDGNPFYFKHVEQYYGSTDFPRNGINCKIPTPEGYHFCNWDSDNVPAITTTDTQKAVKGVITVQAQYAPCTYTVANTVAPTCKNNGETVYACTYCNNTYSEVIPAQHSYGAWENGVHTCSGCGIAEACSHSGVVGGEICPVCGSEAPTGISAVIASIRNFFTVTLNNLFKNLFSF